MSLFLILSTGFLPSCSQLQTARFDGMGPLLPPGRSGPHQQGAFELNWPVDKVRVTQHFAPSRNPRHQGLDLGGRRGMPILAAHEGVVVYAGNSFRGYGNMVLLEYNHQWATLYAHLDRIMVREGQKLRVGDKLGTMGQTGRATGVHLHFELIKNKQPIDPLLHLEPLQLLTHH